MALSAEEQAVVDAATGENFLGFDDSGNAIIRNAQGQLSAYGGGDWANVTNAIKAKNGTKSFNDYLGQEQLKAIGGEYQGIDEETGAAVFKKDGQTFGVEKDNADYKNLYSAAQKVDPTKSWFNPEYEKQFNELQEKGSSFSGFDDQGQALFKNKLGQYEAVANKDAGFYKYAQKYKGDQKFGGVQGVANTTAGENITPVGKMNAQSKTGTDADRTKRSLAGQTGGFSRFTASNTNPGQLQSNAPASQQSIQPGAPTPQGYAPPTVGSKAPKAGTYSATSLASNKKAKVLKKKTAQPQQQQMGIKDIALSMGKEYATNYANQKLAEAKTAAKGAAVDIAKTATQPFVDSAKDAAKPMTDNALGALKDATGIDTTKSVTGQAANAVSNATGIGSQYLTDPKAAALNQLNSSTGMNVSAAINDPKAYLTQKAGTELNKQLGFDAMSIANDPSAFLKKSAGEALNAQLGFNATELINDPKKALQSVGTDLLAQYAGDEFGALGSAAKLLRGNVVENARNLAKEEAKKAALNQIGSMSGIDTEAITGGLQVGKDLLKGGVNEATATKAGETAARTALATATGGVATPESMQMASDLRNKGYDILQEKLGTLGTIGGFVPLKLAAATEQVGADVANAGIQAAGATAGSLYNYGKEALGGLKMIGKGDLGGVGNIAKAALNNVVNSAVKTPVAVAKKVVASVSNAVKSIFCFDGDTEILMEDSSYKKIKDIKLGDRVELGGLVTAIGQSASNEIYDYNGVIVSSGHALFEDGKWTRVSESKNGKQLKGDERVVYPMSTEHHIIVTKGQIWADNLEVDDTYDLTDTDIMKELNKKTVRNKMLKTYLKVKFGIS